MSQGQRTAGIELQRHREARKRLFETLEAVERDTAVDQGVEIIWSQLERVREAVRRVLDALQSHQRAPEIVDDLGVVRIENQRLAVSDERLLVALHVHQRATAIIQGLGMVGGERQGLAVIGQRLFVTPEFGQRAAAVVEDVGVARAQPRGPVEKGQSRRVSAATARRHRQQMRRVEIVWVRLQRRLAEPRGCVEVPAFESGDRALEKFSRREARLRHGVVPCATARKARSPKTIATTPPPRNYGGCWRLCRPRHPPRSKPKAGF